LLFCGASRLVVVVVMVVVVVGDDGDGGDGGSSRTALRPIEQLAIPGIRMKPPHKEKQK